MGFYFLDDYPGEKEITVNENSIVVSFEDNSKQKSIEVKYVDMTELSLLREIDSYIFNLTTNEIVITITLSIDDEVKIKEWLKMYRDVMSYLPNYYSIDDIKHSYTKHENAESIEDGFSIEIPSCMKNTKSKNNLLYISMAMILVVIMGLSIA